MSRITPTRKLERGRRRERNRERKRRRSKPGFAWRVVPTKKREQKRETGKQAAILEQGREARPRLARP